MKHHETEIFLQEVYWKVLPEATQHTCGNERLGIEVGGEKSVSDIVTTKDTSTGSFRVEITLQRQVEMAPTVQGQGGRQKSWSFEPLHWPDTFSLGTAHEVRQGGFFWWLKEMPRKRLICQPLAANTSGNLGIGFSFPKAGSG